jgi:hypothetical protein
VPFVGSCSRIALCLLLAPLSEAGACLAAAFLTRSQLNARLIDCNFQPAVPPPTMNPWQSPTASGVCGGHYGSVPEWCSVWPWALCSG